MAASALAVEAGRGIDSTVDISPLLPELASLLPPSLELKHMRNNAPVKRTLATTLRAAWGNVCTLLGGNAQMQRDSFRSVKKALKLFSDEDVAVPEALLLRLCSNEKCRAVQICSWSCTVRLRRVRRSTRKKCAKSSLSKPKNEWRRTCMVCKTAVAMKGIVKKPKLTAASSNSTTDFKALLDKEKINAAVDSAFAASMKNSPSSSIGKDSSKSSLTVAALPATAGINANKEFNLLALEANKKAEKKAEKKKKLSLPSAVATTSKPFSFNNNKSATKSPTGHSVGMGLIGLQNLLKK